jgi:hypothetical protein
MVIRTLDSPATSIKLFSYFALIHWCWYFCRCWLTTLIAACACSLGIVAQIKIVGEVLLIFTGLWFGIYLGLPSEKYKIILWKKKFEDIKDLLASFRLYFVIGKGNLCIFIIYDLLL